MHYNEYDWSMHSLDFGIFFLNMYIFFYLFLYPQQNPKSSISSTCLPPTAKSSITTTSTRYTHFFAEYHFPFITIKAKCNIWSQLATKKTEIISDRRPCVYQRVYTKPCVYLEVDHMLG